MSVLPSENIVSPLIFNFKHLIEQLFFVGYMINGHRVSQRQNATKHLENHLLCLFFSCNCTKKRNDTETNRLTNGRQCLQKRTDWEKQTDRQTGTQGQGKTMWFYKSRFPFESLSFFLSFILSRQSFFFPKL